MAALVVLLGGNAALSAHWLLVPHRLCQVHGDWEHVAEHPREAAPAGESPAYRTAGKPHEECSLSSTARPESVHTGVVAERGPVVHRCTAALPRATNAQPQIALLFLAPKHSPPA